MLLLETVFWGAIGLLIYSQLGYPLLLAVLAAGRSDSSADDFAGPEQLPSVSFIVAAYAEADVIAAKVENVYSLDYPREKLELLIGCDGSPDQTAAHARAAV